MSLQQDVEFATAGKFIATQCIKVHTKNCKLSTYVHCEIEKEPVVSALRDAINEDLYELQNFNGAVSKKRCIVFSKSAVGRQHQFLFVGFIINLLFRGPGQIDIGEHDTRDEGYDRGTT